MRPEEFLEAMGGVREDWIEDAETAGRTAPRWAVWSGAAVIVLCVAAALFLMLGRPFGGGNVLARGSGGEESIFLFAGRGMDENGWEMTGLYEVNRAGEVALRSEEICSAAVDGNIYSIWWWGNFDGMGEKPWEVRVNGETVYTGAMTYDGAASLTPQVFPVVFDGLVTEAGGRVFFMLRFRDEKRTCLASVKTDGTDYRVYEGFEVITMELQTDGQYVYFYVPEGNNLSSVIARLDSATGALETAARADETGDATLSITKFWVDNGMIWLQMNARQYYAKDLNTGEHRDFNDRFDGRDIQTVQNGNVFFNDGGKGLHAWNYHTDEDFFWEIGFDHWNLAGAASWGAVIRENLSNGAAYWLLDFDTGELTPLILENHPEEQAANAPYHLDSSGELVYENARWGMTMEELLQAQSIADYGLAGGAQTFSLVCTERPEELVALSYEFDSPDENTEGVLWSVMRGYDRTQISYEQLAALRTEQLGPPTEQGRDSMVWEFGDTRLTLLVGEQYVPLENLEHTAILLDSAPFASDFDLNYDEAQEQYVPLLADQDGSAVETWTSEQLGEDVTWELISALDEALPGWTRSISDQVRESLYADGTVSRNTGFRYLPPDWGEADSDASVLIVANRDRLDDWAAQAFPIGEPNNQIGGAPVWLGWSRRHFGAVEDPANRTDFSLLAAFQWDGVWYFVEGDGIKESTFLFAVETILGCGTEGPPPLPEATVTEYFRAFAESDFAAMRDYCTDGFAEQLFHEDEGMVGGSAWERLERMQVGQCKSETAAVLVTVTLEPGGPMSIFYDGTGEPVKTSYFLELTLDGTWKISDSYTGP